MVLISGDCNLDLLKYNSNVPIGEFFNSMLSYSFVPTISKPTRITDTSATIIDNIFVNKTQYKICSAVIYSDISDHMPIAVHIKTGNYSKKINSKVIKQRIYDQPSIAYI